MRQIVTVSNLKKTFRLSKKQQKIEKSASPIRVAVDGISFSAYGGEIFGLLGPNGAGKTTTLRMLATLIRPDSGDAVINGESVVSSPEAVRARIGFLTSELKLEEYFTPRYLFDFFASLHRLSPEETESRRTALFSRFGIDAFAEVKVANLSTGMKQKLSLVISIVHDPDVIIFDEPTTGLHFYDVEKLLKAFDALLSKGHSIVVVEHNLDVIRAADWVIDLGPEAGDEGGHLVFAGTPEQLKSCAGSYTAKYL